MATTQEELEQLRESNEEKKALLLAERRKAENLQRLIENDGTKSALEAEAANLDAELNRARNITAELEKASGALTTTTSSQAAPSQSTPTVTPALGVGIVAPATSVPDPVSKSDKTNQK